MKEKTSESKGKGSEVGLRGSSSSLESKIESLGIDERRFKRVYAG